MPDIVSVSRLISRAQLDEYEVIHPRTCNRPESGGGRCLDTTATQCPPCERSPLFSMSSIRDRVYASPVTSVLLRTDDMGVTSASGGVVTPTSETACLGIPTKAGLC